jgi:hypothetical protein
MPRVQQQPARGRGCCRARPSLTAAHLTTAARCTAHRVGRTLTVAEGLVDRRLVPLRHELPSTCSSMQPTANARVRVWTSHGVTDDQPLDAARHGYFVFSSEHSARGMTARSQEYGSSCSPTWRLPQSWLGAGADDSLPLSPRAEHAQRSAVLINARQRASQGCSRTNRATSGLLCQQQLLSDTCCAYCGCGGEC